MKKFLFKSIYLPVLTIDGKLRLSNGHEIFDIEDNENKIKSIIELCDGMHTLEEINDKLKCDKKVTAELFDFLERHKFLEFTSDNRLYETISKSRYKSNLLYYLNFSDKDNNVWDIHNLISSKTVLLLGLGGASNISAILAGMGVGKIIGVDFDKVESSNLSRQFIFSEKYIGEYKTKATKEVISGINSEIDIEVINEKISSISAIEEILTNNNVDFIVNGLDRPSIISTRWVNNISVKHKIPFIQGGVSGNNLLVECFYPTQACYDCLLKTNLDSIKGFSEELNSNYGRDSSMQNVSFSPYISLIAGQVTHYIFKYFIETIKANRTSESFTKVIGIEDIDNPYTTKHTKNNLCPTCCTSNTKSLESLTKFF